MRRTIDLGRNSRCGEPPIPAGTSGYRCPALGRLERVAPGGQSKSFPLGGRPTALAAGSSGVWVAGAGSGPLTLLIDRASGASA